MPKRGGSGSASPLLIGVIAASLLLFVVGFFIGPVGKSVFGDLGLPAWLSVPRPAPELPAEVLFHVAGFPVTNSLIGAWLTMIFLVGFSFVITRRMKLIPGRLQSAFEFLLGSLFDFCRRVAGEENGRRFFPVVATIFLFVLFNAWLSLVPGFGSIEVVNAEGHHVHLLRGANTDINMPLALAAVSFFIVAYFGLKSLGFGYVKQFFNVGQIFHGLANIVRGRFRTGLGALFNGFINTFVGFLEFLGVLIRIVSFTFRLFGNMTAGEILLLIVAFLIPWVVALPFYVLELLVGFVQALIFAGLTLVFMTLAVARHGEQTA
ncbi:MAG: FoF1 ATP synthase subunit a [Dehalococcoidales bacterium]